MVSEECFDEIQLVGEPGDEVLLGEVEVHDAGVGDGLKLVVKFK